MLAEYVSDGLQVWEDIQERRKIGSIPIHQWCKIDQETCCCQQEKEKHTQKEVMLSVSQMFFEQNCVSYRGRY